VKELACEEARPRGLTAACRRQSLLNTRTQAYARSPMFLWFAPTVAPAARLGSRKLPPLPHEPDNNLEQCSSCQKAGPRSTMSHDMPLIAVATLLFAGSCLAASLSIQHPQIRAWLADGRARGLLLVSAAYPTITNGPVNPKQHRMVARTRPRFEVENER
jgi:hypothetical protein